MNAELKCPQKDTLVNFLLGKLTEPEQVFCESHVADCDVCEDTLRGLNLNDTLHNLTRAALSEDSNVSESKVVEQLLADVRQLSTDPQNRQQDRLILERAAEVSRFLVPSDDPSDIGRINNYRITELLGAGSAGVVYRAFDEKLEREVALKILRPSLGQPARNRFLVEAKSAAAVDHPNVITIYEVGETDALAYLAMQLLPGETLESRLQREAFLPENTVRSIAADVAQGLQAAHNKELIHRDIKPANIWLTDDDQVKILDFGLARIVNDDPGFTSTGMIAGTPSYMSPEQSKGASLDGRSDLFSLGCLMYRAATGRQPFGAVNVLATLQAIQGDTPIPPATTSAEVSQDLSDLTMCLLEKLPANRLDSAQQVTRALSTDRSQWDFSITRYKDKPAAPGTKLVPEAKTQMSGHAGFSWLGHLTTLLVIGLLAAGGFLFGDDVIRVATGYGQLTIETDDPDVKVEVLDQGKVVRIIDTQTDKQIDIKEGRYTFQVVGEDNSVAVTPSDLAISRGGKEIVRVIRESQGGQKQASGGPTGHAVATNPLDGDSSLSNWPLPSRSQPERKRNELANKVKKLRSQVVEQEREHNYDLAIAELELLENEIETVFQKKLKSPSQIADAHAVLQQQVAMMKRVHRALLPELNGESDDSTAWTNFRKLRTREKLAMDRLERFEDVNKLPRSIPVYNGRRLDSYLQVASTERSVSQLNEAFIGVAKLADQFTDRNEYYRFVQEAWRDYGDSVSSGGIQLGSGRLELTKSLSTSEFRELILGSLGEIKRSNYLATLCFHTSHLDSKLDVAFRDDSDELFAVLLDSQLPPNETKRLVVTIHSKFGFLPKEQTLREKLKQLLSKDIKITDQGSQAMILELDLDDESLSELAVDAFNQDKNLSFKLFQRFEPGSKNASHSVPFLVQIAMSGNQTHLPVSRLGGGSGGGGGGFPVQMRVWNEAARTLVGYMQPEHAAELVSDTATPIVDELLKFKGEQRLTFVLKEMHTYAESTNTHVAAFMSKVVDRHVQAVSDKKNTSSPSNESEDATKTPKPIAELKGYSLSNPIADDLQELIKEHFSGDSDVVVDFEQKPGALMFEGKPDQHKKLSRLLRLMNLEPTEVKVYRLKLPIREVLKIAQRMEQQFPEMRFKVNQTASEILVNGSVNRFDEVELWITRYAEEED